VGQGRLKVFHLLCHSQKICIPQTKHFFRVQTRRLAASFEPLNSSLPLSAPELRSRKSMCDLVVLAQKSLKVTGRQSVN